MAELAQVLRHVGPVDDPAALVDLTTGDDAVVYRLAADRALVVTADFFTPIVDDPYDFGRIAAANALSDVYAMGAKPLFVLNLVGFPRELLGDGILEEIIRGGSDAARSAGAPVLGGHSIDDREPKYGMVAIGEVHPDRIAANAGAQPGDVLVLTKPLGSGVIATAIKSGDAPESVVARAVEVMAELNRVAAETLLADEVHACTDVTGFGLLGHLHRMLVASGTAAVVRADSVPLIDGAADLADAGHVPGGTRRNLEDLADAVDFADTVDAVTRTLLADAQTSGGLLAAVPPERAEALVRALDGRVPAVAIVGEVTAGEPGRVTVA